MDWQKLISDLATAGVKQEDIAAECGVAQSSVSDLNRGATKSPSFDFGNKLIALHKAKVKAGGTKTSGEHAAAKETPRSLTQEQVDLVQAAVKKTVVVLREGSTGHREGH